MALSFVFDSTRSAVFCITISSNECEYFSSWDLACESSSILLFNSLISPLLSSPFLMLISKSSLSQGFSIYLYIPTSFIAFIAFSLSAYPVSSIMLTSGYNFFASDKNSIPFISGIIKSDRIKSGEVSFISESASCGLLK